MSNRTENKENFGNKIPFSGGGDLNAPSSPKETRLDDVGSTFRANNDGSHVPCQLWMNRKGAATYLNISLRTLDKLTRRRVLRFVRLGRRKLYSTRSLDEDLKRFEVKAIGQHF